MRLCWEENCTIYRGMSSVSHETVIYLRGQLLVFTSINQTDMAQSMTLLNLQRRKLRMSVIKLTQPLGSHGFFLVSCNIILFYLTHKMLWDIDLMLCYVINNRKSQRTDKVLAFMKVIIQCGRKTSVASSRGHGDKCGYPRRDPLRVLKWKQVERFKIL